MKKWVVRFVSLYVFDVVVLLVIGLVLHSVSVGWHALWAGAILTLAAMYLKPWITSMFRARAAKSAAQRTKLGEKLVQFGLLLVVALIVWVLVVIFSGVNVRGFFWGWIIPPVILLIGWAIYDTIDDRVEARAGALYDKATGKTVDAAAAASPDAQSARRELQDGLTEEQRKMLDDLGKS